MLNLSFSRPKVISHKESLSKKTDFKLYDAVLSGGDTVPTPLFDDEMNKFMPLLKDYLKSEDWCVPVQFLVGSQSFEVHDMTPPGTPSTEDSSASKAEDDDYVWDVFYHKPTKLSEWNAIANIGTLCVHFFIFHIYNLCVVLLRICPTWCRTGLPRSTIDPNDSDSDTEPEDEADEDSNGMPTPSQASQSIRMLNNHLQKRNIIRTTTLMKRLQTIAIQVVRHYLIPSWFSWNLCNSSSDMFHEQSDQEEMDESFDEREWR